MRNIQTTVVFLCTRVKSLEQGNWKKLGRMICYLRAIWGLKLTLEANDIHVIKWWLDSTHILHPDMRGHTGQMMSLGSKGLGAVYVGSSKQKINTKSSTETELVGASDALPQVLCTQHFNEHQWFNTKDNEFNQDNQSKILLDKKERGSSSKWTRHININCFFISDIIQKEELCV